MSRDADSSLGADAPAAVKATTKSYVVTFQQNRTFELTVKGVSFTFRPYGFISATEEFVQSDEFQHYFKMGGFFAVQEAN